MMLATISTFALTQNATHELRLQFLRATLATNVDRTFPHRQAFVPRREMHLGHIVLANRTPHHPPAITRTFLHATIRPRAAQKLARNNKQVLGHESPTYLAVIVAEELGLNLNHKEHGGTRGRTTGESFTLLSVAMLLVLRATYTANTFPADAKIPPAVPASPPQFAADLRLRRLPLTQIGSPVDPTFSLA